jgi:CRISPR/Cas system CSM-associated protein Csm3 (group 7 of RAMP superfamily)
MWESALIRFCTVFFEESWSELVVATAPYNEETIERTLNDVDRVYAEENIVSISLLPSSFETK